MINRKVSVCLFSLLSVFYLVIPKTVVAQSSNFFDNFELDNHEQWTIVKGDWQLQEIQSSKRFGLVLNGEQMTAEVQSGSLSWNNYEFEVDMLPIQGWDRNIFFRVGSERSSIGRLDLPTGYALHMSPDWIDLQKWTPGLVNQPDILRMPISWENNRIRHFRILLTNNNIKIFSNYSDETPSSNPLIDYTDNSSAPILTGKIALVITTGAVFPSEVWFDNVSVTNNTPDPNFPSLDVPYISQSNPQWGNDIYDSAHQWSKFPYISRWGCALTAASMVLNYYGFDTTPKVLNEWLQSQRDGYLDGGLLNWIAISRYSYINKSENSPALEYRRLGNNTVDLVNELKKSSPPILKEPGHYIVAKSQLDNSFGINDPAYINRKTLASYGNTFLGMNTFRPTHTDLSYIMLTIAPKFKLQVFDVNGSEILNQDFIDEGLFDDIDTVQNTGKSMRTFLVPTPTEGDYALKISGPPGEYNLSYYAYNTEANAQITNRTGALFENTQDLLNLSFNDKPTINRIVNIETFTRDVKGFYLKKQISKGAFHLIMAKVKMITKFINHSKPKLAKVHLRYLYFQIHLLTPRFIEKTPSTVLLDDIKTLLDDL